jgi:hypothetical protein
MAIKITYYKAAVVPATEEVKSEDMLLAAESQLENGHLPKERYTCSDLFDLVHDPENKGPCKPLKLGSRWSCQEDSHLEVVASEKREGQYKKLGISTEPYPTQEDDSGST